MVHVSISTIPYQYIYSKVAPGWVVDLNKRMTEELDGRPLLSYDADYRQYRPVLQPSTLTVSYGIAAAINGSLVKAQ